MPSKNVISKEVIQYARLIELRSKQRVDLNRQGGLISMFRGEGLDFREVREYQPGDNVRHIDWNVSARTGSTHIKTFNEDRNLSNVIVVDISSSMNFGSGFKTKLEWANELASLLMMVGAILKNKVSLIAYNEEAEFYLPLKKGKADVVRALLRLQQSQEKQKTNNLNQHQVLENVCFFIQRVVRKRGLIFFLSDFTELENMIPFRKLTRKFKIHLIRLFDRFEKEAIMQFGSNILLKDLENNKLGLISARAKPEFKELKAEKNIDIIEFSVNDHNMKDLVDYLNSRGRK